MGYNSIKDAFMRQAQQQLQEEADTNPENIAAAYKDHFARMGQDQSGANLMDTPQPAEGGSESASVFNALTQGREAKKGQADKVGATPQEESPLNRWKRGVESLLTSGNSSLIKQGESMLQSYHQKATQAPAAGDSKRSASAQIAMDIGLKPGTPSFVKFVKEHSMKKGYADQKSGYLSDEEKTQGGLDTDQPFVWASDGTPKPVKTSAFSDAQLGAAGYAERMFSAEDTFGDLETKGFDPTSTQQKIGELVPYIGAKLQTSDQQVSTRAKRDWVRAKLRKESGATIGDQEMASEIETYFPVPGDHPAVVEHKRKARVLAAKSLSKQSAGKYTVPEKYADKAKDEPELPPGYSFVE